jgi:putative transposase
MSMVMEEEFKRWTAKRKAALVTEIIIRTLKEQCAHWHRFETLQHASRVIGDWISFYNNQRPHQALGLKTPAEAFALAA